MSKHITVVPYRTSWPAAFEASARHVAEAFGARLVEIHHIGSTAIPGIHAKPVIDMLAVVDDVRRLDDEANPGMVALGYEAMGEFGIPGRRYFRRDDAAGNRTHQVHAFGAGSPDVERHLAFRDYLRTHREWAEAYDALKRRLTKNPIDIEAYMDGKDSFIKDVQARAIAWRRAGTS
jgi:GrpB-like predicted nucleotidyltransferase (UPF0157 family)